MAFEERQVSIMGSSFHNGAWEHIQRLRGGQQLRVEREPRNKYDPNAISVHIHNQMLGYFPRGFAAEVAPLMDAGTTLEVWKSRDPRFDGTGVIVVKWELPNAEEAQALAGED